MIGAIVGWITGGALDRVLSTIDRKISADTDREALKADIIKTHYQTRAGFMQAGGFWLMLIAAAPFVYHAWAVVIYSVHWCADCAYPKDWTIAALPAAFAEYQGLIYVAIFGVIGITRLRK